MGPRLPAVLAPSADAVRPMIPPTEPPPARPIVVTSDTRENAEWTATSISNPIEHGYPLLALIQDFVLTKICPVGHIALPRTLKL